MREHLRKEIVKRTGNLVQSAAAAARYEEESGKITEEFDRLVKEGKSELEAYQAMLLDIETMKEILAAIPKEEQAVEQEQIKKEKRAWAKKVNGIIGSANGMMWLLTVLLYFIISFTTGAWALTWLLFLSASIGSVLLSMVGKYNKGIPFSRMGEWHGIFWLVVTMAFFVCGFGGGWSWSWLLFIAGSMAEVFWGMIGKMRR